MGPKRIVIIFEDEVGLVMLAQLACTMKRLEENTHFFIIQSGAGSAFTEAISRIASQPASDIVVILDHDLARAGNGETALRYLLAALPEGSIVRKVLCTSNRNEQVPEFQRTYVATALAEFPQLCPNGNPHEVIVENGSKTHLGREVTREIDFLGSLVDRALEDMGDNNPLR